MENFNWFFSLKEKDIKEYKSYLQIKAVVKQNIDKIFILKDKRILILFYDSIHSFIFIMNQNTYKK